MQIRFTERSSALVDKVMIYLIADDLKLSSEAKAIDQKASGLISKAIKTSQFKGKRGTHLAIALAGGARADYALLCGIGSLKDLSEHAWEKIGGSCVPKLNSLRASSATLVIENAKIGTFSAADIAARIAHGAHLRSFTFDKYFTKKTADDKPTLKVFAVALTGSKAAAKPYSELEKLAEGVFFTREVVSEPANIIHPESLAERCLELKKLGVEVEIFGEPEMHKMGFGALLGVGQGSVRESQMVIMRYHGLPTPKRSSGFAQAGAGRGKAAPLAFIGKGVTFDTGGISIKPAGGMEEMKWDMGGAGTVIGLMKALAGRKAKVNVVGAVGLVENMPDGNAQRPGDVVTSYSGQTIEVLNTDAEGRLVLADVLWYVQKHFKPSAMIDLATLTGAIIVALGTSRAGLFSNNDKLAEQLFKAGEKTGEEVWRLPLGKVYDEQINSDIADMQNIGRDREAGSITAAQFLQRFVNDVPWAHLDIAGTAWSKKASEIYDKGATAYGVRLLNEWVKENYE
ncbi:MAG: leucyl aminopeptidase [Alphaproteobacteria bacterium]|nr:leucyl aminopeptidase [Alphaproteobacteria bacterium]